VPLEVLQLDVVVSRRGWLLRNAMGVVAYNSNTRGLPRPKHVTWQCCIPLIVSSMEVGSWRFEFARGIKLDWKIPEVMCARDLS
jgi:hypothetical protein